MTTNARAARRLPVRVPVRRVVGLAVGLVLPGACAHTEGSPSDETPGAQALEAPPPTALAVLLEEKTALGLSPAEEDKLRALDQQLAATNAPLEAKLAEVDKRLAAAHDAERGAGASGGGMRASAGGMGRGRMGGGGRGRMMGGGAGRGMGGAGAPAGPSAGTPHRGASAGGHGSEAEALRAKMIENHAAALGEAFALFNQAQRARALQILDDNGYDPPAAPSPR